MINIKLGIRIYTNFVSLAAMPTSLGNMSWLGTW